MFIPLGHWAAILLQVFPVPLNVLHHAVLPSQLIVCGEMVDNPQQHVLVVVEEPGKGTGERGGERKGRGEGGGSSGSIEEGRRHQVNDHHKLCKGAHWSSASRTPQSTLNRDLAVNTEHLQQQVLMHTATLPSRQQVG